VVLLVLLSLLFGMMCDRL